MRRIVRAVRFAKLVANFVRDRIRHPMDLVRWSRIAKEIIVARGLRGFVAELRQIPARITAGVRANYQQWIEAYDTVTANDIADMRQLSASFPKHPLISIVMPVYNTPERLLREAIESVRAQTYDRWELCIANDCSTEVNIRRVLAEYTQADHRVKVVHREENGHISRA